MPAGSGEPPSLFCLCQKALCKQVRVDNIAALLQLARTLPPTAPDLERRIDRFLQMSFRQVRDAAAERGRLEELQAVLGEERYGALVERSAGLDASVAQLKRVGSVCEREAVAAEVRPEGTYPYRALVRGVRWPAGVDPDRREDYLSEADFVAAFRLDRQAWAGLPRWRQVELKKGASLF